MTGDMKFGAVITLKAVKRKMDHIIAELARKGIREPEGFSVLRQFVDDSMIDFARASAKEDKQDEEK